MISSAEADVTVIEKLGDRVLPDRSARGNFIDLRQTPQASPLSILQKVSRKNSVHVAEITQFGGEHFLQLSFQIILKREPDIEGLAHHGLRLQTGTPKEFILKDLLGSAEGRRIATRISGLNAAYYRALLTSVPLLGFVIDWLMTLATLPHLRRELSKNNSSLHSALIELESEWRESNARLQSELEQLRDTRATAKTTNSASPGDEA